MNINCHLALKTKVKIISKLPPNNNLQEKGEKQSIISWFAHTVPRIRMFRQMEDETDFLVVYHMNTGKKLNRTMHVVH